MARTRPLRSPGRLPGGWPPGRYRGEYTLTRIVDGQPKAVIEIRREIDLR
jgi:hypothetical protein